MIKRAIPGLWSSAADIETGGVGMQLVSNSQSKL